MDFFEAQEHARRRTQRLIFLFALAVVGTVLATYAAAILIVRLASPRDEPVSIRWWDSQIFAGVVFGVLAVVGLASLVKWLQVRQGGSAIATMVGGRPIELKTTDLRERRLLNVVEEMSIASGIPMPAVYLLDQEPGLNAFAAGLTTSDAVVAVTQGTLDKLTREELQGVIAHEFSHILNGDMRLNVRIAAIVFGILVIGLLGRGVFYSMGRGRARIGGGGKKGAGLALLFAVALALMIIGYIGYFFGRLIQAAVSRQREFLADASAVQFTRNPVGIAGALKKIGGYALGGKIVDRHSAEISHFFFTQAFKSHFGGLWATHPPLAKRIRAVDPKWDGHLFEPDAAVEIATSPEETLQRAHQVQPDRLSPRSSPPVPFEPARIVAHLGALTEAHFRHAQALISSIPTPLRESTRNALAAQALVYGLLLSGSQEEQGRQQSLVLQHAGEQAATTLAGLGSALSLLDPVARLPLLQIALPALRSLQGAALHRFSTTLELLVRADSRVTPFEFALHKMLLRQLELTQKPVQRVQFYSFAAVRGEIAVVLSALAHLSAKDSARAFAEGAAQLPVIRERLSLLALDACKLEQLITALDKVAASSLPIQQRVLIAAGHVIQSDGTVTVHEGELFRAVVATLGCPMPSLNMTA